MQAQAPPPAQVALAKPPVVSVPAAVVSSPGVTTLPMNVAGISVAIGQPQKATGACPRPRGLEGADGLPVEVAPSPAGSLARHPFRVLWCTLEASRVARVQVLTLNLTINIWNFPSLYRSNFQLLCHQDV